MNNVEIYTYRSVYAQIISRTINNSDISEEDIWVIRPWDRRETDFSWCTFFEQFELQ